MNTPLAYDPHAPALHRDPYPVYRRLRAEAPVYRNAERGFYALSRHADVWAAFQDWRTFSSAGGITLEGRPADIHPQMIMMDPPRHDTLRDIVKRAFRANHMVSLFARVRELADELVAAIDPSDADFARDLAVPLPAIVIADLLGVARADVPKFRRWSDHLVRRDTTRPETIARAQAASAELHDYLVWIIADRRRAPRGDMMGLLVGAQAEGADMSEAELIGFARLLLVAGNETTGQLIGNMIVALARHPDQRAEVAADPALARNAIEETLRYDAAVQTITRTVMVDHTLHGVTIPQGARLVLAIGSANRDETVFPDPDRFDIHRDAGQLSRQLGFGRGIHFCLGAMLARAEAEATIVTLLRRFPHYVLATDEIEIVSSGQVRGPVAVPVIVDGVSEAAGGVPA